MISATGQSSVKWPRGFTLIELILVLTLLAISVALIAPALSDFIRGRALDSEALRLLSVSRAAQSRAVSVGLPVVLWLDADKGQYGTREESRASQTDPKAAAFDVNDSVRMTVVNSGTSGRSAKGLASIRFLPDGTVDESSPTTVRLNDATGAQLLFVLTPNKMGYEIQR